MLIRSICVLISAVFILLKPALAESLLASPYVGEKRCASCHQEQSRQWKGSHHDMAMQHANEETVLADFSKPVLDSHLHRNFNRD